MARRHHGGSAIGTLLFLFGCLVVLGATFGAGVVTGRYWSRAPGPAVAARAAAADAAATPASPTASAVPAIPATPATTEPTGKTAQAQSPAPPAKMTFYQELTAPLAPSASPPTASSPPTAKGRPAKPATPDVALPTKPEAPAPPPRPSVAAAATGTRYTVQVGAYKARPPAEALRASLAAAGHDAYVVETEGTGGSRYRVRVGSYPTRQAAVDAAARLGGDRYVTTR